jgi:hypothetical protein
MLCQAYWHPAYAFIRRHGYDRDQSEDLSQEFFALLLEKNYLVDADRNRGRFRSFLLTAVKHFLANEWDRAQALKRGVGQTAVSIDTVEAEKWYAPAAVEESTPESIFEGLWALSVLEHVIIKLRSEFTAMGKAADFDILFVSESRIRHQSLRRGRRADGIVRGFVAHGRSPHAKEVPQVVARGDRSDGVHTGRDRRRDPLSFGSTERLKG